ncbi:MAG: type II secretion system protein [Phycisphaerales bacterium]|jgi:prepilin-type N-terminal cleavage/methylation domain-containing protein|nr:type II secretion system protein [Phycisphaerales bacterium]
MTGRRGFTLIEVIVVTVLVAALATVLVSRLTGAANREFDLASDKVSDLLLMYAMRSEFANEPVGISANPDRNSLQLLIRRGDRDEFNDGWAEDISVPEVRLPDTISVSDMEFLADGDHVDPTFKPVTNLPGQPRPRLEVTLQSRDPRMPRTVTLILSGNAWRPIRVDSMRGEPVGAISRTPTDLDRSGQWQEDW